jgi:hypothetical protein
MLRAAEMTGGAGRNVERSTFERSNDAVLEETVIAESAMTLHP